VIAYKKQVLAAIQEDRNRQEREATPRPRDVGWAIFGLFVIISATTTAISLLTGLGLANEVLITIVGGGTFWAAFHLLSRTGI
jgi:hypothetical protein